MKTNEKYFRIKMFVAFFMCSFFSLLSQELKIINVRVGQGDATIIQGPIQDDGSRVNILMDAGNISNRDGGNILRTVLAKNKIKKLDYIIVSHYDADHIGGIVSGGAHGTSFLFGYDEKPGGGDDIEVGTYVDRGDESPHTSQAYKKYVKIANAGNRISLNTQTKLNDFKIDLGNGAIATALAANGYVKNGTKRVENVDTENERSLSFLITYKDFNFLISGDLIGRKYGKENAEMEQKVGEYIKKSSIIIDVLHVNHHGANNASEAAFLAAIKPTIAIISAGNGNKHSHPNKHVLQRLFDAKVYRIIQTSWGTTRDIMPENIRDIQAIYQNDIIITSNGDDFTISTSRTYKTDKNPNRVTN